ncbi:tripartite tricarboxylate transporter TctB family protein [Lonepinella koalarum]|uniref:tripartite tricarboxylate transporter TctB family protein n=1 Tax=Lonepinella koalarum TaxID=53417 RepID=UPI003F6DF21D
MNTKIKKDFIVSLFFALLAIGYLYQAQSISVFSPFSQDGPDSKTVPNIIGGLMLLLSATLFVTTLFSWRKNKLVSTAEAPIQSTKKFPIKLVISLVLLGLYIACYQEVGFIISSISYLILQSIVLIPAEKRKKWTLFIIGLSIVFTVVIYFLFSKYLTLFLPIGLLG